MYHITIVEGRLGADPEVRTLSSGSSVTNLRVAVTEKWKDKDSDELVEHTEWYSCTVFGRKAEVAGDFLKKGHVVLLQGRMRTRQWDDKQGNTRYSTDLIVDQIVLQDNRALGGQKDAPGRDSNRQGNTTGGRTGNGESNRNGSSGRDENRQDNRQRGKNGGGRDARAQRNDDDSKAAENEEFDDEIPF